MCALIFEYADCAILYVSELLKVVQNGLDVNFSSELSEVIGIVVCSQFRIPVARMVLTLVSMRPCSSRTRPDGFSLSDQIAWGVIRDRKKLS